MANTTFSGPVRSENGFQDITTNTTTGAVTTNAKYDAKGVTISANSMPDANASITSASNAGRVNIIPDGTGARYYTLPTPVVGESFRFIYGGGAADTVNVVILGPETDNSVYYVGGVTFANTANEISTVYSDGNSNSDLTLNLLAGLDVTLIATSTTTYQVVGLVTSNTAPVFADQS